MDITKVNVYPGPQQRAKLYYAAQNTVTGLCLTNLENGSVEWGGTDIAQAPVFPKSTLEHAFGKGNVITIK